MAVDVDAFGRETTEKLFDTQGEFLDVIGNDEHFVDNYGSNIVFDYKNMFQAPMTIALQNIDSVATAINEIEYVEPNRPAIISQGLDRKKEHVFDDYRLDNLSEHLSSIYSSLGDVNGFSFVEEQLNQAIQTAMYSAEYELDKDTVEKDIDKIASAWADDGYDYVPGAMSFAITEKVNQLNDTRTKKTENIFNQLAGTIQKNIQSAYENGINIEELHMDFANKYTEASLVALESSIDVYIAEINKRKEEFVASLSKIESLTRALDINLSKDIKENELMLQEEINRVAANVSNFNTFITGESTLVKDQIGITQNIANGYGAIFSSWGSAYSGFQYENIPKE